jgi:hypothetical protein
LKLSACLIAAVVVAMLTSGCLTPSGGVLECAVRLDPDGCLYADGKPVKLADLGRALKSAGAEPATMIRVAVPEGRTDALPAITRELSASGFRRVVFTLPPRSSARAESKP